MSRLALALAAANLLNVSGSGLSAAEDVLSDFVVLQGQCRKLLVGGADVTRSCNSRVANNNLAPDKVLFHFALADGTAVSIVGTDLPNPTPDDDEIRIVRAHVSRKLGTLEACPHPAVGKCSFGNPYAGKTTIRCNGKAGGKALVAVFVTNGEAPG